MITRERIARNVVWQYYSFPEYRLSCRPRVCLVLISVCRTGANETISFWGPWQVKLRGDSKVELSYMNCDCICVVLWVTVGFI